MLPVFAFRNGYPVSLVLPSNNQRITGNIVVCRYPYRAIPSSKTGNIYHIHIEKNLFTASDVV